MKKISLITLFFFTNIHLGHALEETIKIYRGARGLAMGGTWVTTGNYSEALFGNPARHASTEISKFSILDLNTEANLNLITNASSFLKLNSASGTGFLNDVTKLIGKNMHYRVDALTAYYSPSQSEDLSIAAGLLFSSKTNLTIRHTTNISAQFINDFGPNFGFAYPIIPKYLLLGLNLHLIYRTGIDEHIRSSEILSGMKKLGLKGYGKQGVGLDGDFGLFYKIPWEPTWVRVSVGVSANNFLASDYDLIPLRLISGLSSFPPPNDRYYNFGFRFDFRDTRKLKSNVWAFEIQEIGTKIKKSSFPKKIHTGWESQLSKYLFLRLGLNQGYPGGGFGFEFPVLKLDILTYGEELAITSGEKQDRRIMLRLAFEI